MKLHYLLIPVFAFSLYACGSDSAAKEEKEDNSINININGEEIQIDGEDQKNLEEAINKSKDALSDLFGSGENGEAVEVVNFRDLKDFLPTKIGSLKMDENDTEGQTSKIAGFKVSTVSATYRDADGRMEIKIIDPGSASSIVSMLAAWSNVEIDSESGNGYQRTLEYKGHKAFEQYDNKSKDGSFAVMVAKRFIVSIEGDNVEMDDMKDAIDDINIKKLARLAD